MGIYVEASPDVPPADPSDLAESILTVCRCLDGIQYGPEPLPDLSTVIEKVYKAQFKASTRKDLLAARKAYAALQGVRIILGYDRDVGQCKTPQEAANLVRERMQMAYLCTASDWRSTQQNFRR